MNNRQLDNLEICKLLTDYFTVPENADLRFFQGLTNLDAFTHSFDKHGNIIGLVDPFNMESSKLKNLIKNTLNKESYGNKFL